MVRPVDGTRLSEKAIMSRIRPVFAPKVDGAALGEVVGGGT